MTSRSRRIRTLPALPLPALTWAGEPRVTGVLTTGPRAFGAGITGPWIGGTKTGGAGTTPVGTVGPRFTGSPDARFPGAAGVASG
ncbi:hypothetical protein ACFQVD_18135 [Streptosporangium amethystogenes subsp. fukuiense]|uniref:Uncharacterized protein n=1 Tax=Streptosporangium amethystogenes subsp. fukuiense TaxID=698418 RepID=A0ABW2T1G3_9ACTN